ncbi:DUF6708 domain-containing protein [Pseudomonas fontis]|uniref:DUF6708 domain-containing protein n=1 Tax=Pseudomonas fontis TaxID=2942633 RepID=A0ABT5NN45_9PSED|nr:DUF6708 domain-containing protein [Pseudomonas fontis]MDD0973273.1 hypothetical protein [Pseudomonas fontis]MDD0989595.1 hypothetical protein [Pseudomonas fontis]
MYFFEWGYQIARRAMSYEESLEAFNKQKRQPGQPELNAPDGVGESVSASVSAHESIYTYNEVYIDARTPNDEKRGVITFFVGGIGMMLIYMFLGLLFIYLNQVFTGYDSAGDALLRSDYFFAPLVLVIPAIALVVYYKYAFRHLFLEAFTARRLIIRFNRITRKVYLLRPNYLGGLRIMDWDKTQPLIEKNMTQSEGMGGFVVLCWDKGDGTDLAGNPTDDIELTFVGKPTRNARELLAFWEYIRRYMEVGPEEAPPPKKLISKFPWPWLSLKAAWGLDTSFLRHSALWVFVLLNCMLLPAILIHAVGHWVSLLLCYEPRFPKAIENAGRDEAR